MANTYTNIILHVVFAVKKSNSLIPPLYLPRIHAYIAGILKNDGHVPIRVGGIDSHVHVLMSYNVNQPVPDMVRNIKSISSRYINDQRLTPYHFEWQTGYACISYNKSLVENVSNYIDNQHNHHKSVCLEDEIKDMLEKFKIDYDCRYILKDPV